MCLLDNLVTIDFETDAIASALPPNPVGVSIKMPGKPSHYLAWRHPEGNNCTESEARAILKTLFSQHPILMHNAAFDINVAKYWLNVDYPKELHDTLLLLFLRNPHAKTLSLKPSAEEILNMPPTERDEVYEWILANVPGATKKNAGSHIGKAPVSLVGPYACADTDMTFELFKRLHSEYSGKAYERERTLLPILCQSTLDGIHLDYTELEKDFAFYSAARLDAEAKIYKHLNYTFNIDSGPELAAAITQANIPANWVLTKTGKKSTSKPNLLTAIQDTTLLDLLSYRGTLSTYLDTFFTSWLEKEQGGKIHFAWNQVRNQETGGIMGTRTGRLSSQPSMLNVPKVPPSVNPIYSLPDLPAMRKYLIANPGEYWMSRDFDGQELKVLAHYEDGPMMQAYIDNPNLDLHQMMSDMLTHDLGKPISRRAAKTIAFSILYGSGINSLAEGLACTTAEARAVKNAYLGQLPGIKRVQNAIKNSWDNNEPIKTWGDRYYYKEPSRDIIDKKTGLVRHADFTYKGMNYLIQSSSADITKQAIINYNKIKKSGTFLLAVHDQIDISGPLSEMKLLKEAMHDIKLDVSLTSDGSYGLNMTTKEQYDESKDYV